MQRAQLKVQLGYTDLAKTIGHQIFSKTTYLNSQRVLWCQSLVRVCSGIDISFCATISASPYKFLKGQEEKLSYLLFAGGGVGLVQFSQFEQAEERLDGRRRKGVGP